MTRLNSLYSCIAEQNIYVFSQKLSLAPAMTICDGGDFMVAFDPSQAATGRQELHCLLHEFAHIATGAFYTADSSLAEKRRQEARAARWSIRFLIDPQALQHALESGMTAPWQLAEHFDVPQPFLEQALAYYRAAGYLPDW